MADSNKWRKPKTRERARWGGARPNSGPKNRRKTMASKAKASQQSKAKPKSSKAKPKAKKSGKVESMAKEIAAFRNKSLRERFPTMPLEFMLSVINNIDPYTGVPRKYLLADQLTAASRAAPFIHPKLSNVNLQARQKYSVDVDKLDDAELIEFERLLLKCQVKMGEQSPEEVAAEVIKGDYEISTGPADTDGEGTKH